MSTSVGNVTAYKNSALCVAGTEYGIGDTIPMITYTHNNTETTLENVTLTKVEYEQITITTTTGSTTCINTKTITNISKE